RGSSDQAVLQNYFTTPQDWSITDSAGFATSAETVLADTTARAADWATQQRDEAIAEAKAARIQALRDQGFTFASDGTLVHNADIPFIGTLGRTEQLITEQFSTPAGQPIGGPQIFQDTVTNSWSMNGGSITRESANVALNPFPLDDAQIDAIPS